MSTTESTKDTAVKNPAELRDFKKVGEGSIPEGKKAVSEPKQPATEPKVDSPEKLKL